MGLIKNLSLSEEVALKQKGTPFKKGKQEGQRP
jgi:hypothetical protein